MSSSSEVPKSLPLSPECSAPYLSRAGSFSSEASTTSHAATSLYMEPLLEVIGHELDRRDSSGKSSTPSPKKRHVTNLPPEEKRQRRLQRNRVAAKECRKKKKEYVETMETRLKMLQARNLELNMKLKELQAQLTLGLMLFNKDQEKKIPLQKLNF
ncbi:X-box-binding protein 1 [Entomophthora muscae]|uniref:X-box-binding protein 1 n=2 Tax=Entomophthora muscae TaxID=34485 RepID=A0ACC2TW44_9FUNG|nr:X-box-binding protein 1 [Entomophthora muscae]KAJ9078711.1 X-box-binding protein 1 [Entomophthora muscae]